MPLPPPRDDRPYRPGPWAIASALVAGGGYIAFLYLHAARGADTTGIGHVFVVLALGLLPMAAGMFFHWLGRGSQRAGDAAFAAVMGLQGLGLTLAGALAV